VGGRVVVSRGTVGACSRNASTRLGRRSKPSPDAARAGDRRCGAAPRARSAAEGGNETGRRRALERAGRGLGVPARPRITAHAPTSTTRERVPTRRGLASRRSTSVPPRVPSSPVLRAETKSYLVERADVLRAGVGLEVLQDHLLDHQALLGPGIARCGRHGGAARGSGAATGSTRSAICPSAPRARTPRSAHLLGVPKKSSVPRKTVINSGIAVSTTVSFLFRECS
jgi:hypothetical protein